MLAQQPCPGAAISSRLMPSSTAKKARMSAMKHERDGNFDRLMEREVNIGPQLRLFEQHTGASVQAFNAGEIIVG